MFLPLTEERWKKPPSRGLGKHAHPLASVAAPASGDLREHSDLATSSLWNVLGNFYPLWDLGGSSSFCLISAQPCLQLMGVCGARTVRLGFQRDQERQEADPILQKCGS